MPRAPTLKVHADICGSLRLRLAPCPGGSVASTSILCLLGQSSDQLRARACTVDSGHRTPTHIHMPHMLRRRREGRFALRYARATRHIDHGSAGHDRVPWARRASRDELIKTTRLASSLACDESGARSHTHSCESHAHVVPIARLLLSCGLRAGHAEADGAYKSDVLCDRRCGGMRLDLHHSS